LSTDDGAKCCRKLYQAVQTREPKGSFYVCTSFDERPLKIVKTLDADADLLLITGGLCCPEIVQRAQHFGVKRIGCRMEETSRAAVRAAQKARLLATGWPGHSLQDYHLAVGLGVDAICSDIPVTIHTWKMQRE
jgi:glycerophosphoryl diester phosphodiesterase